MSAFRKPWYPWYPSDYWHSASVIAMSSIEDLLYRRVLDLCWMCDGVPSDPDRLQPLTRMKPEEFSASWPAVSKMFTVVDGLLHNARLERERANADSAHSRRVNAGSKAQAMLKQSPSNAGSNTPHRPVTVYVDVPVVSLSSFQESLFKTIFDAYPIKENELRAKAAWKALFPVPDQGFATMLIKAIQSQIQIGCLDSTREKKPHLHSWLEGKRWNDRPPKTIAPDKATIAAYEARVAEDAKAKRKAIEDARRAELESYSRGRKP